MITRPRPRALGTAVLVTALALAGSGLASTAFAADHAVSIAGFAFSPTSITVAIGDTVTWANSDAVGHTATADDASFDTGTIAAGTSKTQTFTTAGTFAYHCKIHPTMTASIVVTTSTTPPPTDTLDPATTTSGGSGTWVLLALVALGGLAMGRRRFRRPAEATARD